MPAQMVEFRANSRTAAGYLTTPPAGRGPGLIVIQEWWGLVDHIKDVADRFAAEGFVSLAPDLFHGKRTTSPDEAAKLFMALNIAETGKELRGAAEYLLSLDIVEPKKVAALGFCMGGQLALFAAARHPDRITATVDFCGIHPQAKVDPAELRVPVLGHFGKQDKLVPEATARDLVERIRAAGGEVEAYFYDADHAFFNDTRPEVYSKRDAELAWTRTLAFLRRHLT